MPQQELVTAFEGWEQIAAALGVHLRTAVGYRKAKRLPNGNIRPALPVEPNFRGMQVISHAALEQWKRDAASARRAAPIANDTKPTEAAA